MGVNEDSGKSLSASRTARRAAGPSGVVALASGDAGGTGQPRDGDGEASGPRPGGGHGLITVSSRLITGPIKARAADPMPPSSMPGGCGG